MHRIFSEDYMTPHNGETWHTIIIQLCTHCLAEIEETEKLKVHIQEKDLRNQNRESQKNRNRRARETKRTERAEDRDLKRRKIRKMEAAKIRKSKSRQEAEEI